MTTTRSMLRKLGTCAVWGAFAAVLVNGWAPAAVRAQTITDDNVAQMVASAKTPADHQALSAFFTSKAEAAMAKVDQHRQMASSFTGKQRENWKMHCNALINSYKEQAKNYTALAKEQQQLASGK